MKWMAILLLSACTAGSVTATGDDDTSPDQPDSGAASTNPDPDTDASTPPQDLGPMITVNFSESASDIVNPERGFYIGYNLRGAGDASFVRAAGYTLAIAIVNLESYRAAPLDSALLTSLGNGFAQARAAGIKLVLRFTYNAAFAPDAPKARILGHIQQLTPLLQANADVIAVMQAGFIGAWGEWHTSTNGLDNDADRGEILDAILAALPATRGVQVRTPMYKAGIFGAAAMTEADAYDGSARARVGHHNDCFLASANDLGTYATPVSSWEHYVADDGRFTAVGGETCQVAAPRTDCAAAIAEMEANHWSFLNHEYHQSVLAGWVTQNCAAEVHSRLGYRLALDRVSHTEAVAPGGELALELDLHNSGFASPYNKRPVELVLTNGATRRVVQLAGVDARHWAPGTTQTLAVRLRIPADLAPGTYTLALRLPDEDASLAADPRYAIQLANDGVWDAATGDNALTRSLAIDASAPGPIDTGATSFVQLP